MRTLYIMRGLPGSGKSYLASQLYDRLSADDKHDKHAVFLSADEFHMVNDFTKYDYNAKLVSFAHKKCQGDAAWHMKEQTGDIIIDNTNITITDMLPYFELASICNYAIILLESQSSWAWDVDECYKRNAHGVPRDIIQSMKDRYQPLRFGFEVYDERKAT